MASATTLQSDIKADPVDGLQGGRLLGLSWLHFLNDGSANYLPGILPAVLISLHQSVALAGVVMGALLIGQALQLPCGWLADRFGGRMFIIWGMVGVNVAASVIGVAGSLFTLIPALVIIGFCSALFHPQALSAARRLSGRRAGMGMSVFMIGGEVGRGVWPLLASILVVTWGRQSLVFLAIPAIISAALLWRSLPVQPPKPKASSGPIAWRGRMPALSVLVGFQTMRALAIFGASTFLPILWHMRGRSLTDGAMLITVLLVVGVIGNFIGGHLADKIDRHLILRGSSCAAAFLLALFLVISGPLQWVVLGLLGVFMFATQPTGVLIGQEIFPEHRSLGSGIALGFANGMAALGVVALGLLVGYLTAYGVLWVLVGAFGIAFLLSFSPFLYHKKSS